jgi:hypothetical protein
MRDSLLVLILVFVVAVFVATSQSEPGAPDTHPVFNTQGVQPPDDGGLPPVLGGTLPPTVTPFATLRVTPTLDLPVGELPPGCGDCAGSGPGFVNALLEFFGRVKEIFRK